MYEPAELELFFNRFITEMSTYLPEGAAPVDIDFLERLNLLNLDKPQETALTRYFNILESQDKITLMNDQFIIWIIPDSANVTPKTLVLVALNQEKAPHLELAFVTSDIYNSSKLVLRILEKVLSEIQENEDSIKPYLNHSE